MNQQADMPPMKASVIHGHARCALPSQLRTRAGPSQEAIKRGRIAEQLTVDLHWQSPLAETQMVDLRRRRAE
jgi:hypothetical protein